MLIRNLLKTLTDRRKSKARRRLVRTNDVSERLESRTLLTGNVQVSLSGANAQMTGDAANNEFEVVVDSGSVVVRGLNGTTINHDTAVFTLVNGGTTFPGNLTASLGAGDDIATIGPGITFAGNVSLSGDAGTDTLRALTGTYNGNLSLMGGDGASSIVVDGAKVSRDLGVFGRGATVVSISNSTIHGRLDAWTGLGNSPDSVVIKGTTVDQKTKIVTGPGDDNVVIQNSNLNGQLIIFTGAGDDVVSIDSSSVDKFARIATQRGDDTLQVLNSSSFSRVLIFAGGPGHDSANIASDTSTHRLIKRSQKAKYFDAATVASRITNPATGAIAVANALVTAAVPTLTVTTSTPTFAENAGASAAALTVTRTGPTTSALVVSLSSSNTSKASVPASITIPVGSTSANVFISAVGDNIANSDATVTITASASGFPDVTTNITVTNTDVATLTVTSNAADVSENAVADTLVYTVRRNTSDNTLALVVNLSSNLTDRLTVPATVTIPAGQESVTFVGSPVDDSVLNGNSPVIVTASATGFTSGSATVTVKDNDAGALTVTANTPTVSEGAAAGTLTYTIVRSQSDVSQPLTVTLVSDTPGRLTVLGTVTIEASQTEATFDGTPVNNNLVDGNVDVIVTASASGFSNTTASVTVNDNDAPTLTVTPTASAISENYAAGTFYYTVARNTLDLTQALTVNLTSANTARLGVPATITLRAGSAFEAFEVTPVNNTDADGNVDVTLTANATGFADASWVVTVIDDEAATPPPSLTASLTVAALVESSPADSTLLTVTRTNTDTTSALVVNLTYSDPSRISGPATITIPATESSASVLLSTIDNFIVDGNIDEDISATAPGFKSSQTALRIIDNELATLSVTTAASVVAEDSGTLAGTVSTSLASSAPIVVSLFYQFSNVLTGPSVVVIPAGATSVPVTFTINNGSVTDENIVARIATEAFGTVSGEAQVTVTDADSMSLTTTAGATDAVQSNGTIITRSSVAQVVGTTAAGATITIDSDGDGVFDNGTTIAGNDGSYSVDVNLSNTATNHGKNRIVVRAVDGPNSADTGVNVHMAVGTVVHFATNVGAYDVELLDTEADNTVTNFLSYVASGAYQNMFVHRANVGSAQFIQGGGFKVSNGQITSVVTNAAITNQFNPANGNIAGTLAMALTESSIDSGTSGWFINTIDNSAGFDPGKYTVFGRVIGDGLTVVQQISSFGQANLNTLYSSGALATVPLSSFNAANTTITGNVSTTFGSDVLTGTGTLFTSELAVGQSIVIGSGKAYFVASIESDTSLTLTQILPATSFSLAVKKDVVPTDAEFVVFSSIGKILDTL